ncbi:MAG: alpha-L-rhamnosidase C-terminal domain-containing protein [Luteolibacter sp.]|uniref:alpha-L-rhamnosidase-related protein n=1 Tax=Luteolibacter sp. TaxID=1962973 RepID=UPI003262E3F1
MNGFSGILAVTVFATALPCGALPPTLAGVAEKSPLTSFVIQPKRIVWKSDQGVANSENLLKPHSGQAVLSEPMPPLVIKPGSGIVIDFGVEIVGSVDLFTPMTPGKDMPSVHVRFGESVAETMVEIGERGAENDHALRDMTVKVPWLGKTTVGPSGFRFIRIDNADPETDLELSQVRAVLTIRDIPYVGSFKCSDERLNKIWQTGAYTVHLNMQDYLWDGIKRDRLVWLGDMHPEVSVIDSVFGYNEVVPKSLDMTRDVTPVTDWMNGISSYSMWWILIHEEWYLHHGNLEYLKQQQPYLTALLMRLTAYVEADGREKLDGTRFLDWPTADNKVAVHEGLQAMMTLTMESGARLTEILGDKVTAKFCTDTAALLRKHVPESSGRKSPAALLSIAGFRDPADVSNNVLKKNGPTDLSTFYGFYVLNALAKSNDIDTGLDFISQYWGGMLDQGATTFWEDFDLAWTKNAGPIDQLVAPGKKDLHGDFGAYCYVGFRHSFCHGWAGGPTAWLSKNILGVTPVAPGCMKVKITPHLGRLTWAEGTYPTPKGPIHVRHDKQADGSVKSTVNLPAGIEQVD